VTLTVGDTVLTYQKRTWKLPDSSGQMIEKGLRYGENPGQEAALYELKGGNLALGELELIAPGQGLISAVDEDQMLQAGKHPGKTNLTDVDNALHMLRYLTDKPACAIMKHNNPSGAAQADDISTAYHRAFMGDLIAAFGGAAVLNRPVDKATAEMMNDLYLEVVAAPDYEDGAVDHPQAAQKPAHPAHPPHGQTGPVPGLPLFGHQEPDGRRHDPADQQLQPHQRPADLLPARCEHKGKVYEPTRKPTQARTGRRGVRLGRGTGGDQQQRDLRERRLHRGHRHRRAGPGGRGPHRGIQGLHQIRQPPGLGAPRTQIRRIGDRWARASPAIMEQIDDDTRKAKAGCPAR
jgi:phosphoribosylaminoimidazolecarboxamide formyltransferase/IMP cyclohydrolase